jgi:hypothetical protein
MSTPIPTGGRITAPPSSPIPQHWTPEQALAVFECLQALREALWLAYGSQVQQAWREQLMPGTPPEFDPDEPF